MRPRPTKEQFLPPAHAYDARGCKGNLSSRHAAPTCYAATGKSITAIFTPTATLSTTYTYTPFGKVTSDGDVEQPIQWSSEMHDAELDLVYYNYRYYNPTDGRWTRRDLIGIGGGVNLYGSLFNKAISYTDFIGLAKVEEFRFYITYRIEYHGATLMMANIEEAARAADKITDEHMADIIKITSREIKDAANANGSQFRYFLRFTCECDDGCFILNMRATKPKIKARHFLVTTTSLDEGSDAHHMGFSAIFPIPKDKYEKYVKEKIDELVNQARQKCTSECAAV